MLTNGLGEALERSVSTSTRVFDLFTGSGSVACHVARNYPVEVIAGDLQKYSSYLAGAVITRTEPIASQRWINNWFQRAELFLSNRELWRSASELQLQLEGCVSTIAGKARELEFGADLVISRAYAGYYFSPWQSLWLDALRNTVPQRSTHRRVALASLIKAASKCAAAPGHTAQPFKPNSTAGKFLISSWALDLPGIVRSYAKELSEMHAQVKGQVHCKDAFELSDFVQEGDLVFLDPPYSGVHYSRFYHVLETVARGAAGEVSGSGRYPPASERPTSDYSMLSRSKDALDELFKKLSNNGAAVLITFPAGAASNGLSGDKVRDLASSHFKINETKVSAKFSTLGGDKKHRAARHDTHELILTLSAR